MILYYSAFAFFALLYYIAEKKQRNYLLWIVAIFAPVLFEGLREETVGEDMLGYGTLWFYEMNEKSNIKDVILNAHTPEYAYHLMLYFCKKMSSDIHFYMTVAAFIKIICVYYTAYYFRKQISGTFFIVTYFLFFYVEGFSMMRQSIADAICILSLIPLVSRSILKFIGCVAVAYFFHNSGIFMLVMLPIGLMRNLRYKYVYHLVFAGILYGSVSVLLSSLINTPIFKEGIAEHYLNSGVVVQKYNILITICVLLFALYIHFSKKEKRINEIYFMTVCAIYTLTFLFLASYVEVAHRVSYYTFIPIMFLLAFFMKSEKKKSDRHFFITAFLVIYIVGFYFQWKHGLNGSDVYKTIITL